MALPTAATPGYTLYRDAANHGWVACTCLAQWLDVYERMLLKAGEIKHNLDIWQLTGGAAASAGTHSQGGAFDLLYQTSDECVRIAREMGATATWRRTTAQGFSRTHLHGVLRECPHNDPAAYQLAAQYAGRDGLGWRGMQGADYHPRPTTYRTWREGITWAESQLRTTAAPTPVPEEDDMPTPKEFWRADIIPAPDPSETNPNWQPDSYLRETFKQARAANTRAANVEKSVAALAGQVAGLVELAKQQQGGGEVDLAAVQAAAKAGTQDALSGYSLTLDGPEA